MKPTKKAYVAWFMAELRSGQSKENLHFIRELVDEAKVYYGPNSEFIRDLRADLCLR